MYLASATPSMGGCSWEPPPTIPEGLEKSFRKPRSLGFVPCHLATTQSPGIGVQEIVMIGESAGLQGPACFNLVIAPLAGVGEGRQQMPGSLWREKRLLTDSHLVPTPNPEVGIVTPLIPKGTHCCLHTSLCKANRLLRLLGSLSV